MSASRNAITIAVLFLTGANVFAQEGTNDESKPELWRYSAEAERRLLDKGGFSSLRHVDLGEGTILHAIARWAPDVETVILSGPRWYDKNVLEHLAKLESLETLVLDSTDVSDDAMEQLRTERPDLVVLRSQKWAITQLRDLGGVVGRQDQRSVDRDALRTLVGDEHFVRAKDLAFPWDEGGSPYHYPILNEQLMPMKYLNSLVRLDLRNARITDAGMHYLSNLTDLEHLRLPLNEVSSNSLSIIRRMKNLKTFTEAYTRSLDDNGLKHVARAESLVLISAGGPDLTDAGLVHLRDLKQLQGLWLNDTSIYGEGLRYLTDLPLLTTLHMDDSKLENLRHIPAIAALTHLNAENTNIDDASLAQLSGATNLESLDLSQTQITDAGLAHLNTLPNLRRVDLSHTKVTRQGVDSLQSDSQLRITATHLREQ